MKKKSFKLKVRLVFCFLLLTFFGNGQKVVSGFLGKRNTVGYSLAVAPSLHSSELTGGIGIVGSHQLNLERTLSSRTVFMLQVNYSPSKFDIYSYNFNQGYYDVSPNDQLLQFQFNEMIKGHMRAINFGFKFFKGEYVAPVGRFIKLSFGYFDYGVRNWKEGTKGSYTILIGNTSNQTTAKEGTIKTSKNLLTGYSFSLGFGKAIPLNDRLIFEFSSNLNFLFSTDFDYDFMNFDVNEKTTTVDSFIFSYMYGKMKYRHLMDFAFAFKYTF